MIAALFVERGGVYWDLEGVDPWDEKRDARLYAGPWPVVAHPPCERWGRFAKGGPWWLSRGNTPKVPGDDAGCFEAALSAVRRWGGVLEHPADSLAWRRFGLHAPRASGWWSADDSRGITCRVEQGHYGHRARKATWLYACHIDPPPIVWGPSVAIRSATTRRTGAVAMLCRAERRRTPLLFRDLLLSIAMTAVAAPTQQPPESKESR